MADIAEPLALRHSWPLFERERQFALGLDFLAEGAPPCDGRGAAPIMLGAWQCDLRDDTLTWSPGVHDLFGLPHDARPLRHEIVGMYAESSRAIMERLRAYAIKHRRGFSLDAEIHPASGGTRWMRLIASPVCEGNRVVRLNGLKLDASAACR